LLFCIKAFRNATNLVKLSVMFMSADSQEETTSFRDLLRASWVRTSIKLGVILTAVGLIIIGLMKVFNIAATPLFSNMGLFFTNYGLAGIFLATILAGTIVPVGSPALVAAATIFGVNPILLVIVASVGFTLGMAINYGLAYRLGRPYVTKRMAPEHLEQITRLWSKWGLAVFVIFGLTPVLPVELLSFICGLLKTRVVTFIVLSLVPRLIVFTLIVAFGEYVGAWIGA
jgi:membrane protein YqaA with SNARE-associated domain